MKSNVEKLVDSGMVKDECDLSDEHKEKIAKLDPEDVDRVIETVEKTRDSGGAVPNYY